MTAPPFEIRDVAHLYKSPVGAGRSLETETKSSKGPEAVQLAPCHLDAICSPDFDEQARATALIVTVLPDGAVQTCSGTLLNTTAGSARAVLSHGQPLHRHASRSPRLGYRLELRQPLLRRGGA